MTLFHLPDACPDATDGTVGVGRTLGGGEPEPDRWGNIEAPWKCRACGATTTVLVPRAGRRKSPKGGRMTP